MSIYRKALIGIICVAFLGSGAGAVAFAGDTMTITGTINEDGQLVDDSGKIYDVNDDEMGAQVMELSGEKIVVEATLEEGDGSNVIVIKSFKELQ